MLCDDRLIVALDTADTVQAKTLVKNLGDSVSFYKIGLGLVTNDGLGLAAELTQEGKRIFLDMKLFDIETTIKCAVANISRYNFDFLTVHGDPCVVRAAVAGRGNNRALKILAVTILTSIDASDLKDCLLPSHNLQHLVVMRAQNAFAAGADGVIASAQEATLIRRLPLADKKLIITPGIRMNQTRNFDQKRVTTPAQAFINGADHIVIGRPIWQAKKPKNAVQAILRQLPNCTQ